MLVILDTNVLLSALINASRPANQVYEAWRAGEFAFVSSEPQPAEIRHVTRRPAMRALIKPAEAGRLINIIRRLSILWSRRRESRCHPILGMISRLRWQNGPSPITW